MLLVQADKHNEVVYGVHTTRGIINGSECYPVRSIRTETHKLIWNPNWKTAFRNVVLGGRDRAGYWLSWVEKAKTDEGAARFVNGYQHRPEFELYDLRKDPFELNNLADEASSRELMMSLHKRLQAWMKQQGDKGAETELAYQRGAKKKRTPKKNKSK